MKYLIIDNLILILLVVGIILLLNNHSKIGNKNLSYFKYVVILIIIQIIADTLEGYYATFNHVTTYRYITAVIGYIVRPFIIYALIWGVNSNKKSRKLLLIPGIINALLYTSSIFTGLVFSYSSNNIFIRGPLGYTVHTISLLYFIIFIYYLSLSYNRVRKEEKIFLLTTISFPFAAVLVETLDLSSVNNVLNYAILISVLFFYIFVYIYYSRRDTLTGLFNRQAFYEDLKSFDNDITSVFSIDMNGLKVINDTYGHNAGDIALVSISNAFSNVISEKVYVYRLGGDEFSILCRNMNKKEVERFNNSLIEEIATTDYTCSIGYTYRKKNEPIDTLYKTADNKMYRSKSHYYASKQSRRREK